MFGRTDVEIKEAGERQVDIVDLTHIQLIAKPTEPLDVGFV